jgi:HlyD family secretion protein
MSGKKKLFIALAVVVVLGAIAFANFRFQREDGIAVNFETIQRRDLESVVSASGKIQPKRSVNISADTMGRVTSLSVNEGDQVTKGQFLLEIDPRNLRTRVESGEASLQASASQLQQMRLSIEAAKVNLKAAQDNHNRQQELWKGGLTTRENLERTENELKSQQANLRAQEQNLKTQELRIAQERASLSSAQYDLSRVRLESPINGIVTRRNIEEGETAVTGTMNNPGTVLLTIADMSILETEVEVDETDIPTVKIGQAAKVTIDALPGKTFTAKVTEIGNSPIQAPGAAAAAQATNFKVVLTLDGEVPNVRPGFTCTAEITTATRKNVIAVPIQATTVREMVVDQEGNIVRDQATAGQSAVAARRAAATAAAELKPGHQRKELEGVFIVADGKAQFAAVQTGIPGDKYFEVLSGLKEGDQVIVGPFSSVRELRDGALVTATAAPRSTTATTTKPGS